MNYTPAVLWVVHVTPPKRKAPHIVSSPCSRCMVGTRSCKCWRFEHWARSAWRALRNYYIN